MSDNIFDLETRTTRTNRKNYSRYNNEDKDAPSKMEGYELMPQEEWKTIKVGDMIKYEYTADDDFRKGGLVRKILTDNSNNELILTLSPPSSVKMWDVQLKRVLNLWIRRNGGEFSESVATTAPKSVSVEFAELTEKVKNLEELMNTARVEIMNLKTENKKLITLMSKLNEKIDRRI
jgi:hypothetical protein